MAIFVKCNASDIVPKGENFSGEFPIEKMAQPTEGDDVFIWTSERPRASPNGKGLVLLGRLVLFRKSGSSAKIQVQIVDRTVTKQLGMSDLGRLGSKFQSARNLYDRIRRNRRQRIWSLDGHEQKLLNGFFEQNQNPKHSISPAAQTEIRIRWNNKASAGWTDHLPASLFSKIGETPGFVHICSAPHARRLDAKCNVRVHERYADLDYLSHKNFNVAREIFLGVTRIHFVGNRRQEIRLIEWRHAGSTEFVNLLPTVSFVEIGPNFWDIDLLEMRANEGSLKLATHLRRERDARLVKEKKRAARAEGELICEICQFDFEKRYGILGSGFCEVHHRKELAEGERVTSLNDLAILCSNCHRMIHKTNPMVDIETFRKIHLHGI